MTSILHIISSDKKITQDFTSRSQNILYGRLVDFEYRAY